MHFLQQAMLLKPRVKAALPNTQKQTQGGCQIKETRKYSTNERTDQNSRKITKWNGDKQPIICTVQNTGYQDALVTHWVLQQHKKVLGRNESCIK